MKDLISKLSKDFPKFNFRSGNQFCWVPSKDQITYKPLSTQELDVWSLLHELAHAELGHKNYESDFELVLLESDAWEMACKIAQQYAIKINNDYLQNCLDSYRDWLYIRSTCPSCSATGIQINNREYRCFNCSQLWQVSDSRFARPYKIKQKTA